METDKTGTLTGALFDAAAQADPAALAAALAPRATAGHFDEWRGRASPAFSANATKTIAPDPALKRAWSEFFSQLPAGGLARLDALSIDLERQIRDNGVSYNVHADAGSPQRPWALDLFPLIVEPTDWQQIEAGVLQRMRLLDAVLADVYGPQRLLGQALLPPALVHGHPGYLRALHEVEPVGGTRLHIAAFDLGRDPDGRWWVVSQRTQAPSGLGYLLENRLAISRLFPQAFEALGVQRLAATYRDLMTALRSMSPGGTDAHIALLTPGPYNETYFEHAYLARYLGLTLVEGHDLTVRGDRLYLKTLRGLEPVHGLIKRLDDDFLDPLELRHDSTLGVPGLLQVLRAGQLLMANLPGSAFLESPALLGFLPALSQALLGEDLSLPALPTWWCGERAAMEDVLPRLADCAIKPTFPTGAGREGFDAALGHRLSPRERDEWAGRILRAGDDHTVQQWLPMSELPAWRRGDASRPGRLEQRQVMLRVFAVTDGPQSWRVLPGGLVRLAQPGGGIASMQRGGSSADAWVRVDRDRGERVDRTSLLHPHQRAQSLLQRKRLVTSRAAENLYWMGRYSERAENTVRLCAVSLAGLNGESQDSPALLAWLTAMARYAGLVRADGPSAQQSRRVFERSLVAGLGETGGISAAFNLAAVRQAATAVRERLSREHWRLLVDIDEHFRRDLAELTSSPDWQPVAALRLLEATSTQLAAVTGLQTDRMTRDDGWRLLSIGRHIERLSFLAQALQRAFETGAVTEGSGFDAVLALFDSTITFQSQFQQSREAAALLDLLVLNRDNPRSLGWVAQTLRGRLARLAGSDTGPAAELALKVPTPEAWVLEQIADPGVDGGHATLTALLDDCVEAAWQLSDEVSALYFTHSASAQFTAD